jgi:hypothetical protein
MKRGKPPQRKTYLKRSTKRIKVRRGDPAKRRWANLRDDAFREWIREQPCAITGCITRREIECAHVKARGAGGDDLENCLPLCRTHHQYQHTVGIKSFAKEFHVDLAELARQYTARFLAVAFYV